MEEIGDYYPLEYIFSIFQNEKRKHQLDPV